MTTMGPGKTRNLGKWSRVAWPLAFLLWAGLAASADTLFPGSEPAGSSSRVYKDGNVWV